MDSNQFKLAVLLNTIFVGCVGVDSDDSQAAMLWEVGEQLGLFDGYSEEYRARPSDCLRVVVRLAEQAGDVLNRDAAGPSKYQAHRESVAHRQQSAIEHFERVLPARIKDDVTVVKRLRGVYSIVMEIRSGEALRLIAEDAIVRNIMLDHVVTVPIFTVPK